MQIKCRQADRQAGEGEGVKKEVLMCLWHVLVWQDFSAKVTDFGLAKVGPGEDRSHVTTEVMGTMGYACPAYVQTGEFQ